MPRDLPSCSHALQSIARHEQIDGYAYLHGVRQWMAHPRQSRSLGQPFGRGEKVQEYHAQDGRALDLKRVFFCESHCFWFCHRR